MSSTRNQEIKRSLGKYDGFTLYMFEEDLKMIESWADANSYFTDNQRPRGGNLCGLWTNTLNPVVHIVSKDEVATEDYLFMKSPQFKNKEALLMLSRIGRWSFEKRKEQGSQDARFVFLEVEVKHVDSRTIDFHPFLLVKGQNIPGKIEVLRGENPFRLHYELSNSTTQEEALKGAGIIATLKNKFESGKPKVTSMAYASLDSTMQASSVENKQSKKVYPSASNFSEVRIRSTSFPSQYDGKDLSSCTKRNQWYLREQGQKDLKEISNKLEELIQDKPKISRDNDTHNIMILFSFENKSYVISFPPNFPILNAELYSPLQTPNRSSASYSMLKEKNPIRLVEEIFSKL